MNDQTWRKYGEDMQRKIGIILISLLTLLLLGGCSNEHYVVVDITGNQLSLAPAKQNPEEQYALTEVTVDDQTKIDGRTNPLSVLKPGDIIRFEYRKDKQPLVATIERVN